MRLKARVLNKLVSKLARSKAGVMSPNDTVNILIAVLIFSSIIGTIATSITSAQANTSGGASVLLGLTTLIVVAIFIIRLWKGTK